MADTDGAQPGESSPKSGLEEPGEGGDGGGGGLAEAQGQVLERCLHALSHAKNDSHTLAALLLITRLCPAKQLDRPTLRRIFQAVGLDLPARLLVTALQGSEGPALPPDELLSLGSALLAALSTDPDMASRPQLLSTVPILLGVLANGPGWKQQNWAGHSPDAEVPLGCGESGEPGLDQAVAADCYQVLTAVCASPRGAEQLLNRGAVPALCQAVRQNRTLSHQRGLPLLGGLLCGPTKDRAWSRHSAELRALLLSLCTDFCRASDQNRLGLCAQLVQFLPPAGQAGADGEELRGAVGRVWEAMRPMLQAKLTPRQIGPVLVLSACLLDLFGWEHVGSPKFCCLLVNRACVEVRMGLEEPPGTDLSLELQHTLTGCYRIMEAAIEQACGDAQAPPPHAGASALSLQQSRQVLGVLEEAFNAVVYHLQQVDPSRYDDPFVFATFRSLCSWLAEETSCLKQEVTALLPFLIGYGRRHLQDGMPGLSEWAAKASGGEEGGACRGGQALRYLLPALCHLSAEEAPRKVLLSLEAPALLLDFLSQGWGHLKKKSGAARDPGLETACSALLNFAVTEPERVRTDPCFRTLEAHLSEALPALVNKPRLRVLAANYCCLGLMIGRLRSPPPGPLAANQRRFFSAALRLLSGALDPGRGGGGWEESWAEAGELWRLSLQALGGCVRAQPGLAALLREEGWLRHALGGVLGGERADRHTEEALEEALCAAAEVCPDCRQEIADAVTSSEGGAASRMSSLRGLLRVS
ncbi:unnamed protein product [Menidia menidia]|uniref:Neurochondrin n=1 Tax=Menidia menidia TaxID=238744 RepID=A0A8S4AIS4_9TELE|nr:unnamed protein product [Menidia menidia]CAG5866082.1 unnamed protein product [Menidia menidia]